MFYEVYAQLKGWDFNKNVARCIGYTDTERKAKLIAKKYVQGPDAYFETFIFLVHRDGEMEFVGKYSQV